MGEEQYCRVSRESVAKLPAGQTGSILRKKEREMRKLLLVLALCVFWAAPARAAEMTVSGAASLANAFTEIKSAFEKERPGLIVNTNFAASNPLLRQILEGAPVDVFASADQATMDKAEEAKVIDPATRRNFAANDLVLIVPKGNLAPKKLDDLLAVMHIAIGNPQSVPAGRYAREALLSAGLWEKLEPKFIQAASVRQALDYVARGEVGAGIVYGTDARQMADKVDVALVLDGHDPVTYPIALAVTGNNPEAGRQFLEFVLSPKGQAIMEKYGFAKP